MCDDRVLRGEKFSSLLGSWEGGSWEVNTAVACSQA
jgi:hypothetical protein